MSFTREDLFVHQQSLYTKDNLILVVAGKIENQTQLEADIERLFAELPTSKQGGAIPYQRILPSSQSAFFDKKTEQNHLIISAPTFPYTDDRKYAAKVLATIL
jgi:predicted Zn-dependent peptidase